MRGGGECRSRTSIEAEGEDIKEKTGPDWMDFNMGKVARVKNRHVNRHGISHVNYSNPWGASRAPALVGEAG